MSPTASDRDLVLAFKAGGRDAFDAIDRRHRPSVARVCHRMLISPDDAQEAIQETMTRVLRALPTFNGRYLLDAWVTRIATNVCLDIIRASSRRPTKVDLTEIDLDQRVSGDLRILRDEDPSDVVERRDHSRQVVDLLKQLPETHRDALVLREYEGYSHEEIADAMGMTAPRAKALLHRAKKSFRAAWNGERALNTPRILIPLVALVRVLGRIGDRAGNADMSSAFVTASTSVAQVAAAPAVSTGAYAISEKVAAGATAIVAAIGMSATVATKAYTERPKPPAQTIVVDQPPTDDARLAAPAEITPDKADPQLSPSASPEPSPSPSASPQPEGSPQPSGSPEASPAPTDSQAGESPSPSPAASPTSSASPSPAPRPVPKFEFGMRARMSSSRYCACDPSTRLERSDTSYSGKRFRFDQTVLGAVYDSEGDAAWQTRIQYWGSADQNTGAMQVGFTLRQGDTQWSYKAYGSSGLASTNSEGGLTYTFQGDYSLEEGISDGQAPTGGTFSIVLDVWEDGSTVYGARIVLG